MTIEKVHRSHSVENVGAIMSERKTENLVRNELNRLHYYDFEEVKVEEQKSDSPRIRKLLEVASKKGLGAGYPEFIIHSTQFSDFIIVIECKASILKHESKEHNKPSEYAVDGVLLYASYLVKDFDVLAIAVSGQEPNQLLISHFMWLKESHDNVPIFGNKLLSFSNYLESYRKSPQKFRQDYDSLLQYSQDLNLTLHSQKIKESQRSLLISGILIALKNRAFCSGYKGHETAKQLASNLVETISYELANANIPDTEITNLKQAYSFIKTHATLSSDKLFLENLISEIDEKINSFMTTHKYIDALGQFYIEFLRYANNDKGLGIVLTPPHITELFSELANVTKDSVVLDNCCGTCGFLISAMKKMTKDAKEDQEAITKMKAQQLIGIEFQDDIYALGVSNMIIHGDGKTNIHQGNCFALPDKIRDAILKLNPNVGLLNPPYKTKRDDREELEFIINNLNMLQKNGTCIAIVPISSATAQEGLLLELKRKLMKNHTLEAVMSMPNELFHNSKIAVVTCLMVFTAHVPHAKGKKTWFGYWKDDEFIKTKNKGRIDLHGTWSKRMEEWVDAYRNREVNRTQSLMHEVSPEDEWCVEAYMETDYSSMTQDMFVDEVKEYTAYKILNQ